MLPQSLRTNTAMALFQIGPGSALTGVAPWQTGGTGPLTRNKTWAAKVALRQQHSTVIFHLQESKQEWLK